MTTAAPPYLSIVATARNDNHGGDLLGRMQSFIDGLADQCDRYRLDAELVLVEWNPPHDKPGLVETLNWPARENSRLHVRIIQVPAALHARFRYAAQLPLFQMIAKNVGIRRSRGEFVLATNIDILFSDELMAYLARRNLRIGRMYRVDRYDIDPPPPLDAPVLDRLDWAKAHTIRRHGKYDSLDLRNGDSFKVAWRPTWRVRLLEWLQQVRAVPIVTRLPLHLNGCGDFTLLHRDHWFELQGYAELEMYSMHIDSLFCTAAAVSGIKETILRDPLRIYHIEHGTGSGFKPENVEALNSRLANAGIAQLTHAEFNRMAIEMRRERRPGMMNDGQWGLCDEVLPEVIPGGAHLESSHDSQSLVVGAEAATRHSSNLGSQTHAA